MAEIIDLFLESYNKGTRRLYRPKPDVKTEFNDGIRVSIYTKLLSEKNLIEIKYRPHEKELIVINKSSEDKIYNHFIKKLKEKYENSETIEHITSK